MNEIDTNYEGDNYEIMKEIITRLWGIFVVKINNYLNTIRMLSTSCYIKFLSLDVLYNDS